MTREIKLEAADHRQLSRKLNDKPGSNCAKVNGKWKSRSVRVVR